MAELKRSAKMLASNTVNLVFTIGNIVLGAYFVITLGHLARKQAERVSRGEISAEAAERNRMIVQCCGWFLLIGGTGRLIFLLL